MHMLKEASAQPRNRGWVKLILTCPWDLGLRSPNGKSQKPSRLLSNVLCPHLLYEVCVWHVGEFWDLRQTRGVVVRMNSAAKEKKRKLFIWAHAKGKIYTVEP